MADPRSESAANSPTLITMDQTSLQERRREFETHQAFIKHEQDRLNLRISVVLDEEYDLSRTIAHLQRRKNDLEVKRKFIEYERDHDLELSLEHAAFELWEPELRDVCVRFCALPREIRDLISRRILPEALVNRTYSSDGTPSLWESVSSTLKKNFRRISTSAAFAQILNEVAQMFLHKTHFRFDIYSSPKLGLLLDAPLSGTHVAPHRKMRDIVLEVHCSAKDTGFPERYLSQILMRPALDILALHTFKKCDLRVSLKRLYGATVLCKLYVRELLPSLWRLHHQGMVVKMSFGSSTVNVSKSCVVEESDGSRWDLFSGSLFKWAEDVEQNWQKYV